LTAFRHEVEVRFRDLDPMGHAHHSLLLVYFEEARAAFWRELTGRSELAAIDYIMAEFNLRFLDRVLYPARLTVALEVLAVGTKSFTLGYALVAADGRRLAEGRSVQVMYDYGESCSKEIPPDLRSRLGAVFQNH
jgi:acyl-CoA thioester hydrolase